MSPITLVWGRDDGWTRRMVIQVSGYIEYPDGLPLSVRRPPSPLTYEYATQVLRAYGYIIVDVLH